MASVEMDDDKGSCILLTEGANDCHVIAALCKFHGLQEGRFDFYACGNDEKVLKKANALLQASDPKEAIGIVLDADKNLSGKWSSIRDKLSKHGHSFPIKPEEKGTILRHNGKATLGVWIMPNNQDIGMLEDFCATLVDPTHLQVAQQAVRDVKDTAVSSFKDAHRSKAEIHTYLAWQDEPGRPLGQSITSKVLNADGKVAKVFTEWLNNLFPCK